MMMESRYHQASPKQTADSESEELPSLLKHLDSMAVPGFDYDERPSGGMATDQSCSPPSPPSSTFVYSSGTSTGADGCRSEVIINGFRTTQTPRPAVSSSAYKLSHAVSISMPTSPLGLHLEAAGPNGVHGQPADISAGSPSPRRSDNKSYSQPMPAAGAANGRTTPRSGGPDRRFDTFKTWSGRLERQISNLRGRPQPPPPEPEADVMNAEPGALTVDRYFDALQGPELDVLKLLSKGPTHDEIDF